VVIERSLNLPLYRRANAGRRWPAAWAAGLVLFLLGPRAEADPRASSSLTATRLNVHDFAVIPSESGPFSYYRIIEDPVEPFIRGSYRPPLETVVVGVDISAGLRDSVRLRWKWRVLALPAGGDECRPGFGDSAAAVYVTWRRFLKIYSLKFVWSTAGKRGQVCQDDSNLFLAHQTVVLETGGPLGTWLTEEIDLAAEFRAHFEHGDPQASVPELLGIGVMSDGDQTRSVSEGDYTGFALLH